MICRLTSRPGMDTYDRERAHHQAKEGARNMYDEHYGDSDQYDPNQMDAPQQFQGGGYGGGGGGYGGGNY